MLTGYVLSPGPMSYCLFRSELWWDSGVQNVYYTVYFPVNQLRRFDIVDGLYFDEWMVVEHLFGRVWTGDMDQRVPPRPEYSN